MGEMNLLQSKWDGKVGQLVGAKWKNKATVHAYNKPKDAETADQLKQRAWFKPMQKLSFLFAQQLKGITNVSYKNMGLGNALMKHNKGYQIKDGISKWFGYTVTKQQLQTQVRTKSSETSSQITFSFSIRPSESVEPIDELFCLYYNEQKQDVVIYRSTTQSEIVTITMDEKWKGNKYFFTWGRTKVNGQWKYTQTTYNATNFNS